MPSSDSKHALCLLKLPKTIIIIIVIIGIHGPELYTGAVHLQFHIRL